jgi:hypothetical protein
MHPSHLNRKVLITVAKSVSWQTSAGSLFDLILYVPLPFTGPNILLSTFLSQLSICGSSFF